jgi:hypothetical protein
MLLQLAIGGAGILRLSEHVVARSIHEGLLQPLLQDAQDPETYPLYALLPPGRPPRQRDRRRFERHSHVGAQRSDCLAGYIRFELRNVGANYPFERSRRFPGIRPNSRHGDYSRVSCEVGDTQLGSRALVTRRIAEMAGIAAIFCPIQR